MMSIKDVLLKTSDFFQQKEIPSPRLDAEILIGHVLKLERIGLYMNFDKPLSEIELDQIRSVVGRRAQREPVAYIIGEKSFYKYDFFVQPNVLCPRPDTETLITVANGWIPKDKDYFIADVGSGTGCIGLSLALDHPQLKTFEIDISEDALSCTRRNVERHGLQKRVAVLQGKYLDPIPQNRPIDMIISNPPYIPSKDIDQLQPEVAVFEPRLALDGGLDGLDCYRQLIQVAAQRVRDGVILEIGLGQEIEVGKLMIDNGLIDVQHHLDLTGRIRVISGRKPSR